jgi:DNA-binding NtrC family response regulator
VLPANFISQNLIFGKTKKPRAEYDFTLCGVAGRDLCSAIQRVIGARPFAPATATLLRGPDFLFLQAATVTAPVTTLFPLAAKAPFGSLARSSADDTLMRLTFRVTPKCSFLRVSMAQFVTQRGRLKHNEACGAADRGLGCGDRPAQIHRSANSSTVSRRLIFMSSKAPPQLDSRMPGDLGPWSISEHPIEASTAGDESYLSAPPGPETWRTVDAAQLVESVLANGFARVKAEESLQQAYREIEQLKHRLEKENVYLREEVKLEHNHHEVIGNSDGIRQVLKKAEQVAATGSTVLLLGETGTGKELIARTIHDHSQRKHRVMVKVNCAALPASLVESELFGREKGAFTGALTREMGRFELANGSTILLDEIAELPVELQSKLLRVLQEGEFERLGGPKTIKVDVRIIAATSRNLQQAVREGKFREDLFYRLNVFPITIPPLRERREDIAPLVWHFVNDLSHRMGRSIEAIHASTMEAFKGYHWPGNVRELRNVIERFLITSTNTLFQADLPSAELEIPQSSIQTSEEAERRHILHILGLVGWRVRGQGGAAEILGLRPTTLESRMQKLGVVRQK